MKIRGEMGEISGSINEASPTTEPPETGIHLMVVLCSAAESYVGLLIKKSSAAFTKAFRNTCRAARVA